jgi:hypothetical protein
MAAMLPRANLGMCYDEVFGELSLGIDIRKLPDHLDHSFAKLAMHQNCAIGGDQHCGCCSQMIRKIGLKELDKIMGKVNFFNKHG